MKKIFMIFTVMAVAVIFASTAMAIVPGFKVERKFMLKKDASGKSVEELKRIEGYQMDKPPYTIGVKKVCAPVGGGKCVIEGQYVPYNGADESLINAAMDNHAKSIRSDYQCSRDWEPIDYRLYCTTKTPVEFCNADWTVKYGAVSTARIAVPSPAPAATERVVKKPAPVARVAKATAPAQPSCPVKLAALQGEFEALKKANDALKAEKDSLASQANALKAENAALKASSGGQEWLKWIVAILAGIVILLIFGIIVIAMRRDRDVHIPPAA